MKRFLAWLLVLVIALASFTTLASCNSNPEESTGKTEHTTESYKVETTETETKKTETTETESQKVQTTETETDSDKPQSTQTEAHNTETDEPATTETTEPATTETTEPATTETTEPETTETTEPETTETTEPETTETTEPETTETTEPETTESETESEEQTITEAHEATTEGESLTTEATEPITTETETETESETESESETDPIFREIALDDPYISYLGRHETDTQGYVVMNNTAAGFEVRFYGTELTVTMSDGKYAADAYGTGLAVFVDGETDPTANVIHLHRDGVAVAGGRKITLCSFEEPGWHTVKVQKITEEDSGYAKLMAMTVTGRLAKVQTKYDLKIMVFGDSITTGYGNTRGEGVADGLTTTTQNGLLTYATIAAAQLNADVHVFAKQGIGLYTNPYGQTRYLKDIYGKVSPLSETAWDMTTWVPDIVIINIGTNDSWTTTSDKATNGNTVFSAADYKAAYVKMIEELAQIWGKDVKFVLCVGSMESELSSYISSIRLQLKSKKISVYQASFVPRTYAGHPLVEWHETAAETLLAVINNNKLAQK